MQWFSPDGQVIHLPVSDTCHRRLEDDMWLCGGGRCIAIIQPAPLTWEHGVLIVRYWWSFLARQQTHMPSPQLCPRRCKTSGNLFVQNKLLNLTPFFPSSTNRVMDGVNHQRGLMAEPPGPAVVTGSRWSLYTCTPVHPAWPRVGTAVTMLGHAKRSICH